MKRRKRMLADLDADLRDNIDRETEDNIAARMKSLALIGLAIGLPLALAMGRAISGLLFGVAPDDFPTFPVSQ